MDCILIVNCFMCIVGDNAEKLIRLMDRMFPALIYICFLDWPNQI